MYGLYGALLADKLNGKKHALLPRNLKSWVKGRDWFDFEWYVRKGTPMSLFHFISRAKQSGHLQNEHLTEPEFRQLHHQRIDALDVGAAKADVSRFVKDVEALKIWSRDYFHELAKKV